MRFWILVFTLLCSAFAFAGEDASVLPQTGYYKISDIKGIGTPLVMRVDQIFFFQTVEQFDKTTSETFKVVRAIFGRKGTINCDASGECEWALGHKRLGHGSAKLSNTADGLSLSIKNPRGKEISSLSFHYLGRDKAAVVALLDLKQGKKSVHTRYLAHRGSAYIPNTDDEGIYPANTIPAFGSALDSGFAGFELDAHLSTDDVFFVSHDNDLSISSDCKGMITESTSSQVEQCKILRSGLMPESSFGSYDALKTAPISTLKHVLDTYLADPRLHAITIDLKPGDETRQAKTLHALLNSYPEELMAKIIVLTRSQAVALELDQIEDKEPDMTIAQEGDKGWEPLEGKNPKYTAAKTGEPFDAVSISLGLGLGLSGLGHGIFPTLGAIWNLLAGIPKAIFSGHLDISQVRWGHRNIKLFKSFLRSAHEKNLHVIGWTVNTIDKIHKIRKIAPNLDYILTDLPYDEIARFELRELE